MSLGIDQIVSLIGAFLILVAFAANTFEWLDSRSNVYQVLNLLGASALTYTAVVGRQYGFIILEGTWAIVSLVALGQAALAAGKIRNAR